MVHTGPFQPRGQLHPVLIPASQLYYFIVRYPPPIDGPFFLLDLPKSDSYLGRDFVNILIG